MNAIFWEGKNVCNMLYVVMIKNPQKEMTRMYKNNLDSKDLSSMKKNSFYWDNFFTKGKKGTQLLACGMPIIYFWLTTISCKNIETNTNKSAQHHSFCSSVRLMQNQLNQLRQFYFLLHLGKQLLFHLLLKVGKRLHCFTTHLFIIKSQGKMMLRGSIYSQQKTPPWE